MVSRNRFSKLEKVGSKCPVKIRGPGNSRDGQKEEKKIKEMNQLMGTEKS